MTKRKRADGKITKTGPKTAWKLTTDVVQKLEAAFAIDCSINEACAFANVSESSYYEWVKARPDLLEKFERLKKNPILRAKSVLFKGLMDNPELCYKYLKSRLPKEFTDTLQIETKSLHYHIVKMVQELNKDEPDRNRTISRQDVPNDPPLQD